MHDAGQQMELRVRQGRPFGVDVALPIGHDRDAVGRRSIALPCRPSRSSGAIPCPRARAGHGVPRPGRRGCRPYPPPNPGRSRRRHRWPAWHATAPHGGRLPLPISPRPRRRSGLVRKSISLLSWIARTCRPTAKPTVCRDQLSISRSAVTFGLARKRRNPLVCAPSPPPSRLTQLVPRATDRSSSSAPFYRDADPRTHPMTTRYPASEHPTAKVPSIESQITPAWESKTSLPI